jgi:hypothetical protein
MAAAPVVCMAQWDTPVYQFQVVVQFVSFGVVNPILIMLHNKDKFVENNDAI